MSPVELFCANCGEDIAWEYAVCGKANPAAARYCQGCGRNLDQVDRVVRERLRTATEWRERRVAGLRETKEKGVDFWREMGYSETGDSMLALSTGSLYTYGLDRVFGLAKEAGFDGMEVLVDGRWDTRQAHYLKHLMDRHGLPVVSLHSPFHLIWVPGWEQDPIWRLKRTVDLAELLGARVVVAHPPLGWLRISLRVTGASNKRDFWVGLPLFWFVGRPYARWLCDELEIFQKGTRVTVAVENMPRRRIGLLGFDLYQMTRLESLERFRHLTLDTTHLATHNMDIIQTYERLAGRVAHVHLSNYNGREHRLLQDGHLPLADFLRCLNRDRYRGIVTLELQPDVLGDEDEGQVSANLRAAVDLCRRHVAAREGG